MQGEAELRRQLQAVTLGISVALMDETERQANRLVAKMRAGIRDKTGTLSRSIRWTWGNAPAGALVVGKAGRPSQATMITIYAGGRGRGDAYYATWVEFGTAAGVMGAKTGKGRKVKRTHRGAVAHPYFWPAYRAARQGIRNSITRAVTKAAEKA